MSLEHRRPLAGADPPDIGFQAAFGFYLGLVAGGLVALAGLLADVTTATLLGTFPTVVTAVAIVGHVVAKRARGLPERIGHTWRWRLVPFLPAAGFGAAALVPSVSPLEFGGRYLAMTVLLAVVLGVTALGLERLCRNRFVKAITADEPAATWTYQPASLLSNGGTWAPLLAFAAMGVSTSVATGSPVGLLWIAFGVLAVAWGWILNTGDANGKKYYGKRFSFDADPEVERGELRAHERGIRHDQGRSKRLIPWERISGVELTDDELVLERRFRNLRCDRSAIDDPEAVYEAIETLRSES